jgi:NEDD4-binding protein 2
MEFKGINNIEHLIRTANEKMLILMRGISGSGKSHKAKRIVEEQGGAMFSADDYPGLYGEQEEGKIPSFNPDLLGEAHQTTQINVEQSMKEGVSPIIVDNTNTQSWEMKPYVQLAKQYGYRWVTENPDSPWWQALFSENMTDEQRNELIDTLYSKTKHIPKPEKEGDRDPIRMMLDRWEHNPTEEGILESKAPWEQ